MSQYIRFQRTGICGYRSCFMLRLREWQGSFERFSRVEYPNPKKSIVDYPETYSGYLMWWYHPPSSSHSPKRKKNVRLSIHCVGNTKRHDVLVDATQHDSNVYSSRHYLQVSVRDFRYVPTVFNNVATRARRIFHQKVNIIFPRALLGFFSSSNPLLSWLLSHKATLWLAWSACITMYWGQKKVLGEVGP